MGSNREPGELLVADEAAFASAVSRLPYPVFVLDSESHLRALNDPAKELWIEQRLHESQMERSPSHPFSVLLRHIRAGTGDDETTTVLQLSGIRYEVIHSARSPKGASRWLVVMLHPFPTEKSVDRQALRKRWSLTPREAEVAAACIVGRTTPEICESLAISRQTLKTHMARLLDKADCQNRSQLFAKYLFGD